jgi:hypothetical protein
MRHERTSAQREPVTRPDQVWALDYQTDVTADGRQVRFLNVVDEFTREAFATRAARSWSADDTVALLDELIATLGRRPQHVRMDDCPELRRTRCGTGPVHRHRHGLHRFGIDGHCTLIADGPPNRGPVTSVVHDGRGRTGKHPRLRRIRSRDPPPPRTVADRHPHRRLTGRANR